MNVSHLGLKRQQLGPSASLPGGFLSGIDALVTVELIHGIFSPALYPSSFAVSSYYLLWELGMLGPRLLVGVLPLVRVLESVCLVVSQTQDLAGFTG